MTTTLITTRSGGGQADITETPTWETAGTARSLLDAHRSAGPLVADLSEQPDRWAAVEPIIVRLIAEASTIASQAGGDPTAAGQPAPEGTVPAIVRARELGVAQARLLALLTRTTPLDSRLAHEVGHSVVRVRALVAELHEALL